MLNPTPCLAQGLCLIKYNVIGIGTVVDSLTRRIFVIRISLQDFQCIGGSLQVVLVPPCNNTLIKET